MIISLPKAMLNINIFADFLIAKIQEAALKRIEIPEERKVLFHLYLDEFQNFIESSSASFQTILSEAKKYRLFLTLANQTLGQIDEELLGAILSNCSSLIAFRTSCKDAEILAKELCFVDPKEIQWVVSQEVCLEAAW